jgi:hypothetical protein
MQASEVPRAVAAAMSIASSLDLTVDDAIVVHNSNKLTLRLLPCDVLARVAPETLIGSHKFEVELAQRLADSGCPVAVLEPRVEPHVYERDGFVVTLWTYYVPVISQEASPADYANALERLHAGMREIDVPTPQFMDRVDSAQQLVASRDRTPALADADRELLGDTLRSLRRETCSPRRTGCCSQTSKRVVVGLSNSTLPMRPRTSASTIRVSIKTCCVSAASSCWR